MLASCSDGTLLHRRSHKHGGLAVGHAATVGQHLLDGPGRRMVLFGRVLGRQLLELAKSEPMISLRNIYSSHSAQGVSFSSSTHARCSSVRFWLFLRCSLAPVGDGPDLLSPSLALPHAAPFHFFGFCCCSDMLHRVLLLSSFVWFLCQKREDDGFLYGVLGVSVWNELLGDGLLID